MRRQTVAFVVLALALGPGGTLAVEEEPTATPDCMATTETDLPDEECVEAKPVAVQLPVADYWEEWADHIWFCPTPLTMMALPWVIS